MVASLLPGQMLATPKCVANVFFSPLILSYLNACQQMGMFGANNRILRLRHQIDNAFLLANRLATTPTAKAGQGDQATPTIVGLYNSDSCENVIICIKNVDHVLHNRIMPFTNSVIPSDFYSYNRPLLSKVLRQVIFSQIETNAWFHAYELWILTQIKI